MLELEDAATGSGASRTAGPTAARIGAGVVKFSGSSGEPIDEEP